MINFSYYKEVLCANKNNPNMDCNGKCALKKQLKSASKEKDASKEALDFVQKFQVGAFDCPKSIGFQFSVLLEENPSFAFHNEGHVQDPFLEIEHPPC